MSIPNEIHPRDVLSAIKFMQEFHQKSHVLDFPIKNS
jgi:hypothetical protein